MFELLLIYIYGFLFSLLIYKAKFFTQFGIKPRWLIITFITKIAVGILYGYLHIDKYGGSDTWSFFRQGAFQVYHVLYINPVNYLKLVFYPCSFPPPAGLEHYSQSISVYGNESYYLLVRFNAVVRLVSFGFYNVHVVFYNFISFIGILYLIRFLQYFIKGKELLILLTLTIFPGVAFWTSGMHKDGFALAALGVLLYSFMLILNGRISLKHVITFVLSFIIIAILREFILFVLIPILVAFAWTYLKPGKSGFKFVIVILVYYAVAFNIHWVVPQVNVLDKLSFMQQEFFNLNVTSSTIYLPKFTPNVISLLSVIPYGIVHSLVMPYPMEAHSVFMLLCSVENLMLILLTIIVFIFFREKKTYNSPFFYFCIFYTLSLYALAGSLVCNLGALVRYKNTGELFWLLLLVYVIDWEKVKKFIGRVSPRDYPKILFIKIYNM